MTLVSIILALVLEQWRPLVDRRAIFAPLAAYASFLERQFNAGEKRHGMIAWLLAVLPILAIGWILYALLASLHPLLGLLFNVAVLYVTMGFRQESHYFTDIHAALKSDDLARARALLGQWRGHDCDALTTGEVVTLTIESALATSHRHVFGVIFWYALLPGPLGALLYRTALFLHHRWGVRVPGHSAGLYAADAALGVESGFHSAMDDIGHEARDASGVDDRFGEGAHVAFGLIDALPARFTAGSFAIVGNFEDAVYCWRAQASRWPDQPIGVVIAAGAGAIGIRLGRPIARAGLVADRPELGVDVEADVPALDSTVGLVWRALVMWLAVLLVIGVTASVT